MTDILSQTTTPTEATHKHKGKILQIPYFNSDHGKIEGKEQHGPLPGDAEWNCVEKDWEQVLEKQGLDSVMKTLAKDYPQRYSELKYGAKSPKVIPARGDDSHVHQFNSVLSMAVPTIAFKLTQQHFGRPVSPLNYQEPLTNGRDPKGYGLNGKGSEGFHDQHELVRHNKDELKFLDFYDEKSNGEPILRRRKRIPEEYIHQELTARAPHLQGLQGGDLKTNNNPKSAMKVQGTITRASSHMMTARTSSTIRVYGRKGCLLLHDNSYKGFCTVARRLVAFDISEDSVATVDQFTVRTSGATRRMWNFIIGASQSYDIYYKEIQPILKESSAQIWVYKPETEPVKFIINDPGSRFIKVSAKGIGYYKVYSMRSLEIFSLKDNSRFFVNSAIRFLFSTNVNEASGVFMLLEEKEEGRWHVIDLSYDIAVGEHLQRTFWSLLHPKSKEVMIDFAIQKEPAYQIVQPNDESSPLDYKPPLGFEAFRSLVEDSFYPLREGEEKWKIVIFNNDRAWREGIKLGPYGEGDISAEQWNEIKLKYFREGEVIRVVRTWDKIEFVDGTKKQPSLDWITSSLYEGGKLNPNRIREQMASIANQLLGIDFLKEGPGIMLLETQYGDADADKKKWVHLNKTMSAMDFLHEFLKINFEQIYIYPHGTYKQDNHQGKQKETQVQANIDENISRQRREAELRQRRMMEEKRTQAPGVAPQNSVPALLKDLQTRITPRSQAESVLVLQYGSSLEPEISGGPDTPSLYPNVLTISETNILRQRVRHLENEILQRERTCQVCGIAFQHDSSHIDVSEHYKQHRSQPQSSCPYCSKDWTGVSNQEQIDHLESSHKPKNIPSELEKRLETEQEHVEHAPLHKEKSIGKGNKGDRRSNPRSVEDNQSSQQSLSEKHGETAHKEIHPKSIGLPMPEQANAKQTRPTKAKGLQYHCSICFMNINNLSEKKQREHVQNCGVTLDMLLAITSAEGKRLRAQYEKSQALRQPSENSKPEIIIPETQTDSPEIIIPETQTDRTEKKTRKTREPPKTKSNTPGFTAEVPLSRELEKSKNDLPAPIRKRNKRKAPSVQSTASRKKPRH